MKLALVFVCNSIYIQVKDLDGVSILGEYTYRLQSLKPGLSGI